jgi:FkbM family methyltransferase
MELLRSAERERRDVDLHAFEPSRYTFQRLESTLSHVNGQHQVHLIQKGLSCSDGIASLFVVHAGAGTNSLHEYPGWTDESLVEDVPVQRADTYARQAGVTLVGLLKCDAEGHDLDVMKGATGLLERRAIDVVQFEYNHRWIVAGYFLRDAFRLLQPYGYSLRKVTPRGVEFYEEWDSELETFREANFVACTPEWKARFPHVVWWNRSDRSVAAGRAR